MIPTPFFIVGVGRSGTSLLMAMLNSHPNIAMLPETFFLLRHVFRKARNDQQLENLKSDDYLKRLPFEIGELLDDMTPERLDPARFHSEILAKFATEKNTSIVGEKAPKYLELLPILNTLYPNCYVFHIIRDPRDVLMSRRNADWSSGYSDYANVLAYEAQLTYGRNVGPTLFGTRYVEVLYEQLVSNPVAVLSRLADTLGIPYDSSMLDFGRSAEDLLSESERPWKKETTGPLLSGNFGKWRTGLSIRELRLIEDACPTVFEAGLYERATKRSVGSWVTTVAFCASGTLYKSRVALHNRRSVADIRVHQVD